MRTYKKRDIKFWTLKRINKYSMKVWQAIVILMALIVVWTLISKWANRNPLVSPVVVNPVKQVEAYDEVIDCGTPKGYLECKAYRGEITWEQHDRISKIINCESRWNPDAMHVNKNGSVDLGLVQINSIHKNISNADKLDFKKAINWMINKMHKDGNLNAWVCNRKV